MEALSVCPVGSMTFASGASTLGAALIGVTRVSVLMLTFRPVVDAV